MQNANTFIKINLNGGVISWVVKHHNKRYIGIFNGYLLLLELICNVMDVSKTKRFNEYFRKLHATYVYQWVCQLTYQKHNPRRAGGG